MNVINLAAQAAASRGWMAQRDLQGNLRIEVRTVTNRTQVVDVTMGVDGDRDPVAFVWSKAAELQSARDPWQFLRLNMQLTYGRVALKGNDIVVMHAILDRTAEFTQVGKAIYWVAKAADDIEQQTYGGYSDTL